MKSFLNSAAFYVILINSKNLSLYFFHKLYSSCAFSSHIEFLKQCILLCDSHQFKNSFSHLSLSPNLQIPNSLLYLLLYSLLDSQ